MQDNRRGQDDALLFGQNEFGAFDGAEPSADERIKSYLDPGLVASRRRAPTPRRA